MNTRYVLDKVSGLRKKQALTVVYENCHIIDRYERTMNNVSHKPFYKRRQSDYEENCAVGATRVFSTYTYFFNEYLNAEDIANECIEDDKVLCEDKVEAEIMKQAFFKAIKECYGQELHFTTKIKKKKKQLNQITLFENDTQINNSDNHPKEQMQ